MTGSAGLHRLAVGDPYPLPYNAQTGMTMSIEVADEGLALVLQCVIDRPTAAEISSVTTGSLRLALIPSPPLIWIAMFGEGISFDVPYGVGIDGAAKAKARLSGLQRIAMVPETTRLLIK